MKIIDCKYSSSGAVLYECCDETIETFIIPENVTRIAPHAFANCHNLKQIVFSGNLKKIEDNAFQMCVALEEIDLPNSRKLEKMLFLIAAV